MHFLHALGHGGAIPSKVVNYQRPSLNAMNVYTRRSPKHLLFMHPGKKQYYFPLRLFALRCKQLRAACNRQPERIISYYLPPQQTFQRAGFFSLQLNFFDKNPS